MNDFHFISKNAKLGCKGPFLATKTIMLKDLKKNLTTKNKIYGKNVLWLSHLVSSPEFDSQNGSLSMLELGFAIF